MSESLGLRRNLPGGKNTKSKKKKPQKKSSSNKRASRFHRSESTDQGNATSGTPQVQHGDEHQAEAQKTPQRHPLPQGADEEADKSPSRTEGCATPQPTEPSPQHPRLEQPSLQSPHCGSPVDLTNLSKTAATPKPTPTVNRTSWPEWLAEKYDYYVGLEFSDGWRECLVVWTELERAFEFRNPVSHSDSFYCLQRFLFTSYNFLQTTGFPSSHRPEQIANWIQNRRTLMVHRQPKIKNVEAFITAFWSWWNLINPSWRIRVDDRLKIGGSGPWDSLHKPGQNGFLTVLQILNWWRGLLDSSDTKEWDSAVEDVLWVMKGVQNSLINSGGKKRTRDDILDNDGDDSQRAAHTRSQRR
jgi:hypothetical protein